MFKRLPFKKGYLLPAGITLLFLVSYNFAFKGTIEAWQNNRLLHAQLERSADLSYQPGYLDRKNLNLDKIIQGYKADTLSFRTHSITLISGIAEKEHVSLSEVPIPDPYYHTDKYIIQRLIFEGDFFSLTRVLDQLETASGIGVIRSASYKAIKQPASMAEDKKLTLEICLEIVR